MKTPSLAAGQSLVSTPKESGLSHDLATEKLRTKRAAGILPAAPANPIYSASGQQVDPKTTTYAVLSGACGTVGASFRAGRRITIVPGTYGSTGWHQGGNLPFGATGFWKVETTKRDGTSCTCHVFDAKNRSGTCYVTSCNCGEGIKWQDS